MALIEAACDKDINVREVVGSSLYGLGQKHPALVLSSCNSYLFKQPKVGLFYIFFCHLSARNFACVFIFSICHLSLCRNSCLSMGGGVNAMVLNS